MSLTLHAPVNGFIVELSQVPDPVFAQKMVGDGFAIEPLDQTIYSPVNGTIKSIAKTKHAITIATESGFDILVHLGLETVALNGEGLEVLVTLNQVVDIHTPLLNFDLALISKKIKSLITPVIITDYQSADIRLNITGICQAQMPILNIASCLPSNTLTNTNEELFATQLITITNPHGLHARPAALLSHTLKSFNATGLINKNEQSADLKSVVSLMGLGIQYMDKITITTRGVDAHLALAALTKVFSDFVDDPIDKDINNSNQARKAKVQGNQYFGLTAAKGLVIGELQELAENDFNYNANGISTTHEKNRLSQARLEYARKLHEQIALPQIDKAKKEMLNAHLELLEDSSLDDSSTTQIHQGKSAEYAWEHAMESAIKILDNTKNTLLQERIADLKDIRKQILYKLTNSTPTKKHYSKPTILLSDEFTLSDILDADKNVVGFISTKGGRTSHVSIIANNNNLPLLIQVDKSLFSHCGKKVILNATDGFAVIDPDAQTIDAYQRKITATSDALTLMLENAAKPAITQDGKTIHCYMNIKSADACIDFAHSGAEGIGLFRSEFIFYDRTETPSEEEQLAIYNDVLKMTNNSPVIIRTLDAGGDKQIDYLHMPHEMNPFLGVRGIRLCLKHPDILRTQLRAIIRTENPNAHIMLPMVTHIDEFREVKAIYEEECQKLGISIKQPLGIMVEVPSVVFQPDIFAKEVDFMSIGTNDLTQYLLAMDREHDLLAAEIDHLHPAVINAISLVQKAATRHHTKLSICGLMAADQEALAILIGLGIEHLSMRGNMLAENKALIRRLTLSHCQQLAQQALHLESAEKVRYLVRQQINIKEGIN